MAAGHANQRSQRQAPDHRPGARQPRQAGFCKLRRRRPHFLGTRKYTNYDLAELASTSTGRRSSRPGSWPGPIPPSSPTTRWARRPATCINDAQKMLTKIIDEKWLQASAVIGFGPPTSRPTMSMTSLSMATRRANSRSPTLHTLAPADGARSRAAPTWRCPDFIAPVGVPRRLYRRLCGHGGPGRRQAHQEVPRPPRTIIPPSCCAPWPTGWRKPLPSACTNWCARITGAMRRTRRSAMRN